RPLGCWRRHCRTLGVALVTCAALGSLAVSTFCFGDQGLSPASVTFVKPQGVRGGAVSSAAARQEASRPDFRGSGYANWVADRILLGRFPYVEPSRLRGPEAGRRRLVEVLGAGVDVFVSLISELPPQWEHEGQIRGFTGYYAPVRELAAGYETPRDVKFLHFPIDDMGTPSLERLGDIVDQLVQLHLAGRTLYIHCWGGKGRAGTVGASLIGRLEGLSADEVLKRVQIAYSARKQDPAGKDHSPETKAQVELVRRFLQD
ncbi:unnamed protein product, partial [Polarella glacialis]